MKVLAPRYLTMIAVHPRTLREWPATKLRCDHGIAYCFACYQCDPEAYAALMEELQESTCQTNYSISLLKGPNCWIADLSAAPNAAEIKDLFGTMLLPCPFTPMAQFVDVVGKLKSNHPPGTIFIEGTGGL